MKYVIAKEVFDVLPTACVGIVAVKGVDNTSPIPELRELMDQNIALCESQFEQVKVKESPDIVPYREAFRALGMNPNKFMCSIEALLSRIAKKKGFPTINPLVDLGNAVSIRHHLPMGAHDLASMKGDLEVRFAKDGDTFVAFGETETEIPEANELVYVSGQEVRTRRWTWRQSEVGKITGDTTDIFYPIDGFTDFNKEEVLAARDELAELIRKFFGREPILGFVDRENPVFEIAFRE
jgi:DNA/RNA-binding domain of Phe-tRNA-synthetase-like protein